MTAVAITSIFNTHDRETNTRTEDSPIHKTSTLFAAGLGNATPKTQMGGAERTTRSKGKENHKTSQNFKERDGYDQDISRRSSPSGHNPDQGSFSARGAVIHPVDASPNLICTASKPVSKIYSKNLVATSDHRSDRIGTLQPSTSHVHRPDHDTQLTSQTQRAQQIDDSNPQVTDALEREVQKQEPQTLHDNPPDVISASFSSHASKQPEAAVQVARKRKRVFSHRSKTGCMTCRRRKKKCDEQHPACKSSDLSFVLTAFPGNQLTGLS
jgi:hypothetical protein